MYANIPQKKCSSKALGSSCREILSEIRQLTFLIDDSNELANLKTDLQGVYQRLKELAPSDGGLQVERGETTLKKRKLPNTEHPHKKLRKIPKAQPKKSKFSGRHGSKAAIMKKTFKVHVEIPKENHNPVATTHGAATCTKVPVTSDKVTTPSNTTPAAAAQVPPECATRQAPITTPATDVQMSTGTRVLADANQVSPFIPELTTLTQESAAPTTVPSTVTQSTIVPKTIPKVSTNQVPSSLNAAAQATTQIPATLTTKHATTTQVPPTQTTMPTDATNVPTPQATSIQVPANLVTVQPTATQILSTPKKAPKQAVPVTKTVTPQQTPSYHTPVYTAKEIKMPSSISGDPVTHCKIASSSHEKPPIPILILDDNDKDDSDDGSQDTVTWLTIDSSRPGYPDSKLTLYKESRDGIVKPTYWLHDSEIHAGQVLLKKQFPHVDGLQDPAITGPQVVPATSEFVQVVNVGRHWVCISTIGCQVSTVKVFDSLYGKPTSILIEHACRMLHVVHPQDTVTFLNEKVQRQIGGSDCGLFALAFVTDLCHGLDPSTQRYSQREIRQHYVNCLELGRMTPFPKTNKRVHYHLSSNKTTVPVFCLCRLPNDKKEYVECLSCHGWYHLECASIPKWAVNSRIPWKCPNCRTNKLKVKVANRKK